LSEAACVPTAGRKGVFSLEAPVDLDTNEGLSYFTKECMWLAFPALAVVPMVAIVVANQDKINEIQSRAASEENTLFSTFVYTMKGRSMHGRGSITMILNVQW
jgi:hypothetical protein